MMMDGGQLQRIMTNEVAAMRFEKMKTSQQLMLGELIILLDHVKDEKAHIRLDFDGQCPRYLDSWRGSYCEIAINYDSVDPVISVAEFVGKCKDAVGDEMEGYKGGEFIMGRNTPVWVSNYGMAGNLGVIGVKQQGDEVIIITGECEL